MKARLNCSPLRGARGFVVVSLAVAAALPACGGSTTPAPKGDVIFTDANNYTSDTSLTIPVVQAKAGADLMVCWNGLQKDLLCHDITGPGTTNGIDNVGFAQIPNIPQSEVSRQLAVGGANMDKAAGYAQRAVASADRLKDVPPPANYTSRSWTEFISTNRAAAEATLKYIQQTIRTVLRRR